MASNWLEFLYQAVGSPNGIALTVSDTEPCRQALYRARTAAQDPVLDGLQIRVRSDDELWIVKGQTNGA